MCQYGKQINNHMHTYEGENVEDDDENIDDSCSDEPMDIKI